MTKLPKTKTMRQLHKILWKLVSEFVRRSDADVNGYCKCCTCDGVHRWQDVDCGHYISRGHWYTRYMLSNLGPQCKGCNAFRQGDPVEFREYLVKIYGEDTIAQNEKRKNWPAGFTRDGLWMQIEEFRARLEKLKEKP